MREGPPRVVVVGAGIGGMSAAAVLSARGYRVLVLESAPRFGGKMSVEGEDHRRVDAGPTVLTLRSVFDALFEAAGARLDDHLTLEPAEVLARHAWGDGSQLDLYADPLRSEAASEALAGSAEVDGFRRFCASVRRTYDLLERPFLWAQRPTLASTTWHFVRQGLGAALALDAHRSMWQAICSHFRDPRLRQLFARYATYVGSSPFLAPATLNLIARVEQDGVWRVRGGMHHLAVALAGLVWSRGGVIRTGCGVAEVRTEGGRVTGVIDDHGVLHPADAVIVASSADALAGGLLGDQVRHAVHAPAPGQRSLSAVTLAGLARPQGLPLLHHNVIFGRDPEEEYGDLFERRTLPRDPTVYLCAQDRGDVARELPGPERMLMVVCAPALGDGPEASPEEIEACLSRSSAVIGRAGLSLDWARRSLATPATWARRFPGTGGALYGAPSHGWNASFQRPAARTRVPGLYLAGGTAHPGAGVPMVALSGLLACDALSADLPWTWTSQQEGMPGGTSTP